MPTGLYEQIKTAPKSLTTIGRRGIVALPVALEWGDELTEIYSTDFFSLGSLEKFGTTPDDISIQPITEALKNCYKALVFRADIGGDTATKTAENLVITAKYPGLVGNDIAIKIEPTSEIGTFDVKTFLKGYEMETQTVKNIDELTSNNWVTFEKIGDDNTLKELSGVVLEGGTNGIVSEISLANFLNRIKKENFDTVGFCLQTDNKSDTIINFVKTMRNVLKKPIQGVVYDFKNPDYEGIINVIQGYKRDTVEVPPINFVAYVAGLTAGAEITESNTYHVVNQATEIINDLDVEDIKKYAQKGYFLLTKRIDDVIVVENDLNSFVSYTTDKNFKMSDNKIVRILDTIVKDLRYEFETTYAGKLANTVSGLATYKTSLINRFKLLQDIGAIKNFVPEDLEIKTLDDRDDLIIVKLYIQPVGVVNKIFLDIVVN